MIPFAKKKNQRRYPQPDSKKTGVLSNALTLLAALVICFLIIEMGYRLFDPYPYISSLEINQTEYGNLSEYDEQLGWKGVPNGKSVLVTENNRVWIEHNSQGFRDIEHPVNNKPAIVFLGDSFTWGFEIEFNDLFVNRLRKEFPQYEIFNLSHRGYGTDQELLALKNWRDPRKLAWVILVFSENDIFDNMQIKRYGKAKPKFEMNENNELILTHVPAPKSEAWDKNPEKPQQVEPFNPFVREILFKSHFLHDLFFKIYHPESHNYITRENVKELLQDLHARKDNIAEAFLLTGRIIEDMKTEVARRGGRLALVAIPSKREFMPSEKGRYEPYQKVVAKLCNLLQIPFFDLGPAFHKTILRTYYRDGMHLNKHGNEIIAKNMKPFLEKLIRT